MLEVVERVLDFILPRFCPLCGKRVRFWSIVCDDCLNAFEGPLTGTFSVYQPLDGTYHFWWYEDVVEKAVKLYKYADRFSLAKVLAVWLDRTMRYYSLHNLPITFVPTTPNAFKERGFDTMKRVSEKLERIGYAVVETLTARDVPSQAALNRRERLRNVRGKYRALSETWLPPELVIIDDVYTTGATLEECARVLKSQGVKHVIGVTVARVKKDQISKKTM